MASVSRKKKFFGSFLFTKKNGFLVPSNNSSLSVYVIKSI
jgi:hypothetical protein